MTSGQCSWILRSCLTVGTRVRLSICLVRQRIHVLRQSRWLFGRISHIFFLAVTFVVSASPEEYNKFVVLKMASRNGSVQRSAWSDHGCTLLRQSTEAVGIFLHFLSEGALSTFLLVSGSHFGVCLAWGVPGNWHSLGEDVTNVFWFTAFCMV